MAPAAQTCASGASQQIWKTARRRRAAGPKAVCCIFDAAIQAREAPRA
ncbi:hypothetical protein JL2886_02814 [Phaeobacter gallaeciensis]|uniref:Uncharacterized protein n=1 Tax=Phaeobacter gallaeciensis TaxID=60890 RepID=A0A1B0ZUA0_9RHOB|nr:hypothetical protein JL2886_02814 [Phaeobacter gallaeciensis]